MEIGKPKRIVESEPVRDPVPDREPARLPVSPLPAPQPQPSPTPEPDRVAYADPDSYEFEGWPEGHPVAEALKKL